MQVRETTRDVAILHNEQFFAAAQKKYVYIYDKRGLEVHCLKVKASFLPAQIICPARVSTPCMNAKHAQRAQTKAFQDMQTRLDKISVQIRMHPL